MGILKVGVGAAQGVLADSWREYFYCDAMDVDVLAKKGEQRQSKRGFNHTGLWKGHPPLYRPCR